MTFRTLMALLARAKVEKHNDNYYFVLASTHTKHGANQ